MREWQRQKGLSGEADMSILKGFMKLFKGRKDTSLSVKEMLEGERWVQKTFKNDLSWPMSREDVETKLGLQVIEKEMEDSIEAELVPPLNEGYNGAILLNIKHSSRNKFGYAHEVVHYLWDVGIGNKVTQHYPRMSFGSNGDPHEREVDYRAAAIEVPKEELIKDLQDYRKNWLDRDEIKIFNSMAEKYGCDKDCLTRRIKEIYKMGFDSILQ